MFSFDLLSGDSATALVKPQSIILSESLASRLFGSNDPVGETTRGSDARRDSSYLRVI